MKLLLISNEWSQVKEIYKEAFPKAERKPFFLLKQSSKRGKSLVFIAMEQNVLQGFTVVISYKDMVMVEYLAVSNKIRSRGTGSKILQQLSAYYPNKRIVLLIERLDSSASNYQQRVSRKKFYQKNGFDSANIFIKGQSGEMEILKKGKSITSQEYLELQQYCLGKLLFFLSQIKVIS